MDGKSCARRTKSDRLSVSSQVVGRRSAPSTPHAPALREGPGRDPVGLGAGQPLIQLGRLRGRAHTPYVFWLERECLAVLGPAGDTGDDGMALDDGDVKNSMLIPRS